MSELDSIIATFNNRIRREPRIKDLNAKVRDFAENKANVKKQFKDLMLELIEDSIYSADIGTFSTPYMVRVDGDKLRQKVKEL